MTGASVVAFEAPRRDFIDGPKELSPMLVLVILSIST